MALDDQLNIQPFRFERFRSSLRASGVLIFIWALWLVVFTTLPFPHRISLHGTAIILLVGSFWWTIPEGALYLLVMSFVFSALSLTPSGFFWISTFLIYAIFRFALTRFTLSSALQIMLVVFLISFLIDMNQVFLMNRILGLHIFSTKLFLSIFYSSVLQAFFGLLISRPLLTLIEAK